ncbi:transformer-2 protein homolog alpha-like isoform X2 [Mya arenaria]|uniref:transformer-2 protein homolog alpha-like isoform X2 n=1 Tax=Mya arenaria TaxID=6604 RepID=UPI0022E43254|nr:transformer-2 protein homolog alpha-like isoform X2 [Mya arenaria]
MSENGEVGLSSRSPSHHGSPLKSDHGSPDRSKSRSRSASRSRSRSGRNSESHKRKHSYSRSPSRKSRNSRSPYKSTSRHSRSRSRDKGHRRRRSRSRSPMSSRKRHPGNRDDPEPSKCLGVFGLSLYTQERDLREVFGRYGELDECNIVYDRQSGRSRGFAFIYFRTVDDSIEAKDRCTGLEIDGRRIRVDYSITKRAHTPTPGIYLGKPTENAARGHRRSSPKTGKVPWGRRERFDDRHERHERYDDRRRDRYEDRFEDRGYYGGGGGGGGGGDRGYYGRRRSPSPYYGRSRRYSYSRSRSRSYSPP